MLKRLGAPSERIDADFCRERVLIGRCPVDLPRKPLCVLLELLKTAPEIQNRQSLIDQIWDGNFLTGEKGLTQAIWSIRAAIESAGGDPDWIRTVARHGYKWVGPEFRPVRPTTFESWRLSHRRLMVAMAACCALAVPLFGVLQNSSATEVQRIVAANGTVALFSDRAVMVSDHLGRHVNFLAAPPATLRSAAFSSDGEKIFLSVSNGERCQIRVFEFTSQQMENYETCAHLEAGSV